MLTSIVLATMWGIITSVLSAFWGWFVAGAVVVLGLLFSPALRKYTIGAVAVGIILAATFLWGYSSNHTVEVHTHTCDEFRKHLVTGPATDKAINIFMKHGLCE